MLRNFNKIKFKFKYLGEFGLPEHYPIPQAKNQLFYLQRNHNLNTVIYALNIDNNGIIDPDRPLDVYWLRYSAGGRKLQLNQIQKKLAFGYKSWKINNETFKFHIVGREKQDFLLSKDDNGRYQVVTLLNEEMIKLSNIYVYAEEFGVFPQVKFIEFYGNKVSDNFPSYYKEIL